jgi:AAA domain
VNNDDSNVNGSDRAAEPNPFGGEATQKKFAQRQAAATINETRKNRWKPHWFAVAILDEVSAQWSRKLKWKLDFKDSRRDPVSDQPTLYFCGVDAVEAGATDQELAALPKLKPADLAQLGLRAAAMRQDARKQVDSLARSVAAERESAAVAPEPLGLDTLLAEPDEDSAYLIDQVWPAGGRVLLSAQYKAGKSTLVGNVIRNLVDGGQFLDGFDTSPVRKVVLIDTELDKRTLRRWLRDQGIQNTAAVAVVALRGAVSTFDILDSTTRGQWVERLAGADVVILDCLRPVIDSLGLSEDKDAGRVLVAFDALLNEIGADEGLVVTHMGHQNERARGDSRLLDWPDALWKIVRGGEDTDADGSRPRFFSALGRDVEVPEGQLAFDTATRHLAYAGGTRTESKETQVIEKRLEAVLNVLADAAVDGTNALNTTAIRRAVGGKKEVTDAALKAALERGLVKREYHGRAHLYRLAPEARDPMFMGHGPDAA